MIFRHLCNNKEAIPYGELMIGDFFAIANDTIRIGCKADHDNAVFFGEDESGEVNRNEFIERDVMVIKLKAELIIHHDYLELVSRQ